MVLAAAGRPRGTARIPGVALVGSVLVIAVVVNALVAGQTASVTPRAMGPPLPVTMTAVPLTGTTVTGGSSAATTGIVPGLTATSTVTLSRAGSQTWDVVLRVTAVSGLSGGESLVLGVTGLGAGDAPRTVTVTSSTAMPATTGPAVLDGDGAALTVATTSVVSGCHSCSATIEVRIVATGSSLPLFVYPYTVTTAA